MKADDRGAVAFIAFVVLLNVGIWYGATARQQPGRAFGPQIERLSPTRQVFSFYANYGDGGWKRYACDLSEAGPDIPPGYIVGPSAGDL